MTELFAGGLIFGLPFRDPLLQSCFTRGLHGRPSTNGLPVLVIDPRLIGTTPKKQLVEPSPVNALGLDFGLHAGIVEPKRDRTIAPSTVRALVAQGYMVKRSANGSTVFNFKLCGQPFKTLEGYRGE